MSNPAWSLDNSSWTYFRGAYSYGGRPSSTEDTDIVLETDSGVVFVYNLFSREAIEISFRFGKADLPSFRAFHDAVRGQQYAFYISLTGGITDSLHVRKESGFDPVEMDSPGNRQPYFDYVLRMKTETT